MPRYEVIVKATATIHETWLVDVDEQESGELIGQPFAGRPLLAAEFVSDAVVGDERDREIIEVTPYDG